MVYGTVKFLAAPLPLHSIELTAANARSKRRDSGNIFTELLVRSPRLSEDQSDNSEILSGDYGSGILVFNR